MASSIKLEMNWLPLQKRKGGPVGLRNLGNTCYLNSVLQCLTYTPPLANFCLSSNHSSSCDLVDGNTVCAFCLVEKRIFRSLTIESTSDSPLRIYNCLALFAKHFRQGWQEDAHEFLRYVIEACNSVCIKLHKLLSSAKLRTTKQDSLKKSKDEPRTIVKDIFGGVLQSQVKCLSCSAESNKLDDIMDLSLDVFKISSLNDAMCRYFQPEILDGSNKYRCEKCKKLTSARKQMSVFEAPNVLVIQLKRFENIYGGKIDKHISFEERLDLCSHLCKDSQDQRTEYLLYGVIVHAGYSQDSGHYYAFVKDVNGKWFCCNDAHVTSVTSKAVLAEKAYILFYVRHIAKDELKGSEIHKNGSLAAPIRESTSKLQVSVGKQNGTIDTCNGAIGDGKMNVVPVQMKDTTKLPESALKQNGTVDKLNGANGSSCSADQGQGVHHVRFNIVKPVPNGQNWKVANGRADISSIGTNRHSNGNHILSNGNSNHGSHKHDTGDFFNKGQESLKHTIPDHEHQQGNGKLLNDIKVGADQRAEMEPRIVESLAISPTAIRIKRKITDEHSVNTTSCTDGQSEPCIANTANEHALGQQLPVEKSNLEGLKLWLASDTRDLLQRTGWCDMVRHSFRLIKKARLEKEATLEDRTKESVSSIAFANAHDSLRQKVPKEVKEHLVEQLQAHFAAQRMKKI